MRILLVFTLAVLLTLQAAGQTARLQVIHNAADPAADTVDIYLGSTLLLNDFAFRTATPFIDAPAGSPIVIGVAPGTSSSVNDTITSFTLTLTPGEKYVAIANGVLAPATFAPNPDGRATGFTLFINPAAREAGSGGNVEFAVVHGSTDAPTVDVAARGVATLVNNASYSDITGYIAVPPGSYTLDVKDSSGAVTVATFAADLSGLANGAATVFASGFLTPGANQNGPAFGLFAALPTGTVVEFSPITTARLQVIHNAADPAADTVDVYLNSGILLNDFAFRTATPFIDAPAGQVINVGVAPGGSTSAADTLVNFALTLTPGETYVAIANGVLNPGGFAVNPDGRSTGFTLFINPAAREAGSGGTVEFAVLHGATDAPAVDVTARDVATLVNNASYGDLTNYIAVPPASYLLDVTDSTGTVDVVTVAADLSGLTNSAATVFASGFLTPAANQNGPAFGIFAALPTGAVVEFPAVTTARLQVIHNAADPAADTVDVYLNGGLLLNDFAFRTATPFIDAPAGQSINIGIAPGSSAGAGDTLRNFNLKLTPGKTYVALANGVLAPLGFASNPDGRSIQFTLFLNAQAQETGLPGFVSFAAVHGATDAPTVDVAARGVATLVNNAAYGDITGYIGVPPAAYTLDVQDSSGTVTVASFSADLSGLDGGAATVFASGFLTPAANQDGPAFGLYAALPTGTVVEFPAITTARLQVIHNAADPAADTVDVYLNGGILLNDFAFRTATPFIDAPAGQVINVGVAPGGSTSAADTLVNFALTLTPGETYVAIANGVLNPGGFAVNPDGRSTGFTLFINPAAREAGSGGNVEFAVLHGSTDAPTVDVTARGVATLVNNAAYGDVTGYIAVPPSVYTLDVQDSSGTVTVASFAADLSGLANGAATVFASGFLAPGANQNGPGFGIFAALPNGTVVAFGPVTSVAEEASDVPVAFGLGQNYPNPFNPATQITFAVPELADVRLTVFDVLGREVATLVNDVRQAGTYRVAFDGAGLSSGVYYYTLRSGSLVETRRMLLLK
jgi:hypothetical protein